MILDFLDIFFLLEFAQGQQPRVTLIFFLGGCTYTEISAIRFMAQQDEGNTSFILNMLTNCILVYNIKLSSIKKK